MHLRTVIATLVFSLFAALPAWAGPPLICHPNQIGSAPSLPWQSSSGWNGMDASYDVSHLIADTLTLLTPQTPIAVREETLRRAAIYSSKGNGLADRLSSRLVARTLENGGNEPTAWFDAGYFAATVREASVVYRSIPHDPGHIDAAALIRKAIRLGGKNMAQAAAIVEADQNRQ